MLSHLSFVTLVSFLFTPPFYFLTSCHFVFFEIESLLVTWADFCLMSSSDPPSPVSQVSVVTYVSQFV